MNLFPYPSWQKLLQAAMDETDLQERFKKLTTAEFAVFLRLQELSDSEDGHREMAALREGCREILRMQILRLNCHQLYISRGAE